MTSISIYDFLITTKVLAVKSWSIENFRAVNDIGKTPFGSFDSFSMFPTANKLQSSAEADNFDSDYSFELPFKK